MKRRPQHGGRDDTAHDGGGFSELRGRYVLAGGEQRTTDAALSLGPLLHVHGWGESDLDLLAQGTVCGHLLECGAQVTGAYFPDPGFKDVPDLANVGFPIAEVEADGSLLVSKAANTGGVITKTASGRSSRSTRAVFTHCPTYLNTIVDALLPNCGR